MVRGETLVRRVSHHLSLVYSHSNISAKIYQNPLICIEVSVLHQCRFFETQCILDSVEARLTVQYKCRVVVNECWHYSIVR